MTKLLIRWLLEYFSLVLYFLILQIKLILRLKCFFLSTIFFFTATIFKVFIEFITISPLFYVLVIWPQDMWDLSSRLMWNRTCIPCFGRQRLNHWTAKEVPSEVFLQTKGRLPCGSAVKNLPAMRETWVQSLRGENPLEEEMAIHSSILTWKIPWTEDPGGLQSMGSKSLSWPWLRAWQWMRRVWPGKAA